MNSDTEMQNDGTSEIPVAGPSYESPKLFKLSGDCFDEIFDYLSLEDMHSFASTCETMQRVAGLYFERNFPGAAKCVGGTDDLCLRKDNKQIAIPAFKQFVKRVEVYGSDVFEQLQSIEANITKSSIKRISFFGINFDDVICEGIEQILAKVETVDIQRCSFSDDFHAKLLQFCKNLKRLNIHNLCWNHFRDDDVNNSADGNSWVFHEYPKLEHVELITNVKSRIVPLDIGHFLERHPSVRSFSISSHGLHLFRNQLLQCNSQLDVLTVTKSKDQLFDTINFKTICDIIKQLHARNFYKRLSIVMNTSGKSCSEVAQLPGLEKLCIKQFTGVDRLTNVVTLRKLAILQYANLADMDVLAMSLVNLEHVFLFKATLDDILPFIRRSILLSKLKVFPKDETSFNDGILPLVTLNDEREKLVGARKVMIYVPDNMFLKTKWAVKDGHINLPFVAMLRYDLYTWEMSD